MEILVAVFGQVLADWFTWGAANGGLLVAGPIVIQFLKQTDRFPFLNEHSDTASRIWSGCFAIASTVGIGYAYDQTAGVFMVTGVTPQGIVRFAGEAITRYGGQQLFYNHVVKQWVKRRDN